MTLPVQHFRSPRGLLPQSALLMGGLLLVMPLLSGCKLLDQRTFNPNAGKPPHPYIPPAPPGPPPHAPFLSVSEGTPESEYGPVVERAAKTALSRKENVLFIVQAFAPPQATPDAQAQALTEVTDHLAAPVAAHLTKAGAQPIQIEMHAITDGSTAKPFVRVDVR
ncbi:hypothetical protein [Gluconobacter kanchanaburiensis]|uniref:Uncharacterized protein n=1 Tax=Gluconobacter kanchanaburiensis NBRC 103587 TaxID=1307948 RepID=A0A511B7F4_9PROT|nr:hypothetical protein [Gluconobacter kanchanaburiensis]MBF0862478.1 hypothetical protein [Gluconobacter kanchanaburiensis]GBR68565.1 hypothetical protein AA103587_0871 [Gluconobacter kanchanaburiensis NBRC 103587]GEK96400.1 hypothetical protein GKA01_15970 [Gluconobacter kanchanaburiensis NBRC 103587]